LYLQAVGYNCLPSARNEEGLVALTFDRKMPEVCDNQQSVVDALQRLAVGALQRIAINSQLQLSICVDGVRPLIDDKQVSKCHIFFSHLLSSHIYPYFSQYILHFFHQSSFKNCSCIV
jgi:hypothetical protein